MYNVDEDYAELLAMNMTTYSLLQMLTEELIGSAMSKEAGNILLALNIKNKPERAHGQM